MSTQPYDIIAGPASLYVAPVGTSFPLPGAAPSNTWTTLGRTDGGVKVSHPQTTKNLMVDQSILPQKVIRTEDGLNVTTNLAELTLEVFAMALNDVAVTHTAAISGVAGYKSMPLSTGVDIPQFAMLVVGPSPYMNGTMQYELARVLQMGKPDVQFKRDAQAVLATEWMGLEDQSNLGQFGFMRAMTEPAL